MVGQGAGVLFQQELAVRDQAPRSTRRSGRGCFTSPCRCNERDMLEAGRGIQPLLESSLQLYRELIEREGLDCEWETAGPALRLPVARTQMDAYAADRSAAERDVPLPGPATTTATRVIELEPALKPGLAGGWYYDDDAHLRPDKLMASWRSVARGRRAWRSARTAGSAASAGETAGPSAADTDAGARSPPTPSWSPPGAWTPLLNDQLGCTSADPAGQGLQPDDAPAGDLPARSR